MKEGLQAAVDFVKYLLTLAGGAIAFAMQPTFYQGSTVIKVLSTASIGFLCICVISGLMVHSRGCVMLSQGKYDLEDAYLKRPGLTNFFSFIAGFLILSIAIAFRMWG